MVDKQKLNAFSLKLQNDVCLNFFKNEKDEEYYYYSSANRAYHINNVC